MRAKSFLIALFAACAWVMTGGAGQPHRESNALEPVVVSNETNRFVCSGSGKEFIPWGFNYDHDRANRLIEDYWEREWDTVVSDFQEMKVLGANCVRIHLQVGKFMKSETEPNQDALKQLGRLVHLAEKIQLYLDVTGLGCYERKQVPGWYNDLTEAKRWAVQGRFWEAVAIVCSNSPAIFCYDLMNEPIVAEDKKGRDWTPGEFAGKNFVQRLTLDFAGRTDRQIAGAWVDQMVAAIRTHDRRHLVTVGAIPWALTWPTAKPLFYSREVSKNLDFVSLHFYPKSGEIEKALRALAVYNIGKPVVIEEMFPLNCSTAELDQFIDGSRTLASGWLGFYWGKTIEEYRADSRNLGDAMALGWLEYFLKKTPEIVPPERVTMSR